LRPPARAPPRTHSCPGFSSTSDPQLILGRELVDRAGDAPANPASTLGFTTDITGCLDGAGISWGSGESLMVGIEAQDEQSDNAAQNVYFRRR